MVKKIIAESDGNLIRIGNDWFQFETNEDGNFRTGEYLLVKVNKKKRDAQIKEIAESLFSFIDPKLVLTDALKELHDVEIEKVFKHLKEKKSAKPKMEKHCIRMKIAGVNIPIRG